MTIRIYNQKTLLLLLNLILQLILRGVSRVVKARFNRLAAMLSLLLMTMSDRSLS